MLLRTSVLFLTSLLATSLLLMARAVLDERELPVPPPSLLLLGRHLLITTFERRHCTSDGVVVGLDDDEANNKSARGHRAPAPRVAAMATSADCLIARFLSWTLMAVSPGEEALRQKAPRLKIKFLKKPCLKASPSVVLGPLIAY
jgi:hypothetical protein